MLLSVKDGTMSHRGFKRILTMCLLIVGLAFILFILTQTGNSEAATVVPAGPVSDAIYGTWNNASAPYFIEGDIWVPNGVGPAGTLTIDGTGGPVDIYFNGDYSLRIGDPGSVNPAILTVTGVNRNIRFTRNSTSILWDGIKFENSATLASFIQNANITYVSGPNDVAVWLNGTSGININNNEIGHIVGTTRAVGIGLHDPTDAKTTDGNFITNNYIHNISASSPSTEWTCAIRLLSANSNLVNSNVIENLDDLGPGYAAGIYLWNSSLNTMNSNTIDLVTSTGDAGAIGIELKNDCDQNTLTLNQVSIIRALDPETGNAYGIYIHSDDPFLAPDRNTVLQATVDDIYSQNAAAYGIVLEVAGSRNRISQCDISKIYCGQNGWGGSGIDVFNSPNSTIENNDISDLNCLSETATMHGLNLGTTNFAFVANNTFFDLKSNGTIIGIYLDVCFNTTLTNNQIENLTGNISIARPSACGIYGHMNTNSTWDDIRILNVTSTNEDAYGIYIDGTTNEVLMNVKIDEIVSDTNNAVGFKCRFAGFNTLSNAEISDITAMSGFAEGMNVDTTNNDTYIDITVSGIIGLTPQSSDVIIGVNLTNIMDTEIVSLELNTVSNTMGHTVGMRIINSENLDFRDSRIKDISADFAVSQAMGILHMDSTNDVFDNIRILDVGSSMGAVSGLSLMNTVGSTYTNLEILNITSGAGNLAVGMDIISGSSQTEVHDSTISNVTTLEEAVGIYVQFSSNNVVLENNTIWDTGYGIKIFDASATFIGNSSVFDTDFGIFTETARDLKLYNNKIHNNRFWGIAMNPFSWGEWKVDSQSHLFNNPAFFNGTIHIIRGKLTFYNVSTTTVRDVIVETGTMELGGSPNSVISQNVWVDGILYINSSKWEINVSANGEFGIQVNATGTMIIQNNGTGPSTVTDGTNDNDDGTLGVDNFRYYFRILDGSTFRLISSQVSEAGWSDVNPNEEGLYIETSDAQILNSFILRNFVGVTVTQGGWVLTTTYFEDINTTGIHLMQTTLPMQIISNTINTTGFNGMGIYLNQSGNWNNITGNKINTSGTNGYGIYIYISSSFNNLIDNTIYTYGYFSMGIYTWQANTNNSFVDNIIRTWGELSHGIYLRQDAINSTITLNDIIVYGPNVNGIEVTLSSDNAFISENRIIKYDEVGSGIELSWSSSSGTITLNEVETHGLSGFGVYVYQSPGSVVMENTVTTTNTTGWGIDISYSDNCDVLDNIVYTTGQNGRGIFIESSSLLNVSDNVISTWGNNGIGIYLLTIGNSDILNNTVFTDGPGATGIYLLSNSNDNLVMLNQITTNETDAYGINLWNANWNDITENTILTKDFNAHVIRFWRATNNSVWTNDLTSLGDGALGIYFWIDCDDNLLIDNSITTSGSQAHGINFLQSDLNDIVNNIITVSPADSYGLLLSESENNTIRQDSMSGFYRAIVFLTLSINNNIYNGNFTNNADYAIFMDPSSTNDWTIFAGSTGIGDNFTINGDIHVKSTGDLELRNVILKCNDVFVRAGGFLRAHESLSTIITNDVWIDGYTEINNTKWEIDNAFDGEHKITVNATGELVVVNGSIITAFNVANQYDFWVNGTATFKNCTIEYVGYSFDQGSLGVVVTTDSVKFDNVIFNNCMGGILAFASHPQISNIESYNCTITIALLDADTLSITNVTVRDMVVPPGGGAAAILIENYSSVSLYDIDIRRADTGASGIMFVNSSDGYVENAYIQNVTAGFIIDGSQVYVTDSQTLGGHSGIRMSNGANVIVTDCLVSENSAVGMDFHDSDGTVYNCSITNNNIYGINLNNSSPTIEECDILGHDLGIIAGNSSSPFVVNSTISSIINDFHVESDSHPVSLNCTFTNSSTNIWDTSTLTVQWFLHIEVQDTLSAQLPGVNLRVEDNANGTFDSSYTTDGAGRVNWIIVTEYIENSTEWKYFTPYTISAWNATHYGIKMASIWESMLIIITLDTEPELIIGKEVGETSYLVGDQVTYTVWYDYTGLFDLTDVYLNDTFHPNLEYQSDTSGKVPLFLLNFYSWYLGNVTPGNHSFDIVLKLNGGIPNGTVIQNDFEMQYSDSNYVQQPPMTSNPVSTAALAAEITVDKSVENASLNLGDYNTYTIWYNNTGAANAPTVWINDTFHTNLTIISNSALANWTGSGWEFFNVPPGSYSITVVVELDSWDGLYGLLIPNQAISDFFDYDNTKRNQVPSNFANFTVIEQPNVDYIRLELFDGTLVTEGTILTADEELVLYARAYNFTTGFVGNVTATWSIGGTIGVLNVSVGPTITFNATNVDIGNISAIYGSFDNVTGNITIIPGAVVDVKINPPGPETYSADDTQLYVATGYDSDGNENTTWVPQWGWLGAGLGDMTLITPDGYNNSIEFNVTGNDIIRVFVQGNPSIFNTSAVEVVAGKVVQIVVLPIGAEFNTTDEILNFTVLGYDANGNLNTTWIPQANWQGANLGTITVNGYIIEIEYTSVGFSTFNITDSSDPSVYNSTKSVTVSPGAPYQISYVSGNGQFGFPSSALSAPFIVLVEDADGNPVPDVEITWTIDNFPLGATGQVVSNPTSLTDGSGQAQTMLTLGDIPGFYFVNATNTTLSIMGEPVSFSASALSYNIDDIMIGDALGNPITDLTNTSDETITLYAWAYNKTAGILGQIAVNWSVDGGIGNFTSPTNLQTQIDFDFKWVGEGTISVTFENATLNIVNTTGTIKVFPGAVISIILTPSSLSRTTDDMDIFRAIAYDADGNKNWSWDPQWTWEATGLGPLVQIDLYNYSVSYNMIGSDSVNVSLTGQGGIYDTSDVTVRVGKVIKIEIDPWDWIFATSDDIGAFSVIGYDADGFENWSWIPSWIWIGDGLGDLTQIDLYNYTVDYNLTGSDEVFVNVLGDLSTFNSTKVTVSPGAVVTITITPDSQTTTTDDSGAFSIVGYDADGNQNWIWTPIWQWEGSGLGTLTQIDIYNYTVEYDTIGSDLINVTVSGDPSVFMVSDISITVGQIAKIEITPWPGIDNYTGDSIDISVIGYDADGFENWIWTPIWGWDVVSLGALNQITLYNYSVTFTVEGTDAINVSSAAIPAIYNTTSVTVTDLIITPTIDYIVIMDAPGGLGNIIDTDSLNVADTLKLYAVGFNLTTGAFVADIDVIWSVSDENYGTVLPGPDKSTTFTANLTNGGDVIITATNITIPQNSDSTGTITIIPPNIDFILVRDGVNGTGFQITSMDFDSGEQKTFYAAGYNATTGLFVTDISVIWDITSIVGTIDITEGFSTNFTASSAVGISTHGTLKATYTVISDQVSISVNLPPSIVTDLRVTQVEAGSSLNLSWTASSEPDVIGYIIYRSIQSGTGFSIRGTINGRENTTFTNTDLSDGVRYYYYIVAFDDGQNQSPPSAEASAMSDTNTDGDEFFNLLDPDDDNDGLLDIEEENAGEDGFKTDPLNPDTDGDGVIDSEDVDPTDSSIWERGATEEPQEFPWIILVIIILVIVVLLILLLLTKRKRPEDEMLPEEDVMLPPVTEEEIQEEEPLIEDVMEEEPQEEVFEEDTEGISDLEYECPECGYPVSDTVSTCPECGTEFEEEEEESDMDL